MKKQFLFIPLTAVLLFICGAAWASDQPAVSQETPAILAALNSAAITPLDDAKIAEIRGQADPWYRLVRIIGFNTFDYLPGEWSWNPMDYRYGYNGGPGWNNPGNFVDTMDSYFMLHDAVYAGSNSTAAEKLVADVALLNGLKGLPSTQVPFWGTIYLSDANPAKVYVRSLSLIGGGFFFMPKKMPYSEYSRREAVYGMSALLLGKSILRLQ
jgi:hypothetical protein